MHDRMNPPPVLGMPPTPGLLSVHGGSRGREQRDPATTSSAPWVLVEPDPDYAIDELRSLFPCAMCWFGEYTGGYWALTSQNGTYRLLEGTTSDALRGQLQSVGRPTRHRPPSSGTSFQPSVPVPLQQPAAPIPSVHRPFQRSNSRGRHCITGASERGGRC
jgi:hypothetical protein